MLAKQSFACSLLGVGLLFGSVVSGSAERLVQSTTEARTYVFFRANADAVQKLLPAGWVSTPGTGPLKDANVAIYLIEGLAGEGADGKPVINPGKFAVLGVPAKHEQSGVTAPVIVGGFASQPAAAPGAYGVYAPAKITMTKTLRSDGASPTTVEENWEVSTDAGDQLRFNVTYDRGTGTRAHIEPRVYSGAKPEFYRIYKADQVTEVVHSVADDAKRAKKVDFTGSGPQLAKMFDGKEQLIAVMSVPAYYRQIVLPD